jgi:hypothetical protein
VTQRQEPPREMEADKAGSAGDENVHGSPWL